MKVAKKHLGIYDIVKPLYYNDCTVHLNKYKTLTITEIFPKGVGISIGDEHHFMDKDIFIYYHINGYIKYATGKNWINRIYEI